VKKVKIKYTISLLVVIVIAAIGIILYGKYNEYETNGRNLYFNGSHENLINLINPLEKPLKDSLSNKELLKARDRIYHLDYNQGLTLLQKFNHSAPKSILSQLNKLLQIEVYLLKKSNYKKTSQLLEDLNYLKWDNDNLTTQILFLKKIELYARSELNYNRNYKSLAIIHYGLYLAEQSNYSEEIEYMKAVLLSQKAVITITEKELSYISEDLITQSNSLLDKNGLNLSQKNNVNKSLYYILNRELEKPESILNLVLKEKTNNTPFIQVYALLNLGHYYSIKGHLKKSTSCFIEALNKIVLLDCDRINLSLDNYVASNQILLKNEIKYREWISKFKKFEACDEEFVDWKNFYLNNLNFTYHMMMYEDTKNTTHIDSLIQYYKYYANSAEKIFKDENEFHLGDLHSLITSQILSLFIENKSINLNNYRNYIIGLFSETKNRELKRKRHSKGQGFTTTKSLKNIESEIQDCLRQIDDFKQLDGYEDEIYSRLFKLYEKRDFSKLEITMENHKNSKKGLEISEINRTEYLESFLYGDYYYFYCLGKNDFKVYKSAKSKVDSLSIQYLDSIKAISSNYDLIGKELINEIIPSQPKEIDNLVIIPDGLLSKIPYTLLFQDFNFNIVNHFDVYEYYSTTSDTLSSSKSVIFSYSSKETINNNNEKDLIELSHGLEECKSIHNKLKKSKLYTGDKCSITNLKQELNSDLMHIVTHGFSENNERQNCYIILKENHQNKNFYSTEIIDFDKVPKFVCLSACKTGQGHHIGSEGVFSFSRAFLAEGSQAVLETLWDIDDEASLVFMKNFYQNWKNNMSISQALDETNTYMRDSTSFNHPYYWSGFVLKGNSELYLN